jgi:amino acid adenylation domain-containing protein
VTTGGSGPTLLSSLFESRVSLHPDAVAVSDSRDEVTYAELNARANQLASYLRLRGVSPEVRVGIGFHRGVELIVSMLGVLKAGGAYVPLDPMYPQERLEWMLAASGTTITVACDEIAEWIASSGREAISFGEDGPAIATHSACDPAPVAKPDNLAYVIYTSGSTGVPKGVAVTHACVSDLFAECAQLYAFDQNDRWSFFHSPAFDFSVWEIFGALLNGGELVVVPRDVARDPDLLLEFVTEQRITVFSQTPSAFQGFLAAYGRARSPNELALRYIVFGGEALQPGRVGPWLSTPPRPELALINMYGITEITVHGTFRQLSADDVESSVSPIGRPLPGRTAGVFDGTLELVTPGMEGELVIGGCGVARGYLGQPGLTAERFIPDPAADDGRRAYRSGDLVRQAKDGELLYVGRADDQLKIRGYRIEPAEIEAVLRAQRDIDDAVVIGRADSLGDQRLVAYLVGDRARPDADLRAELASRLPSHMVPATFVWIDALPLTPNGKVDRRSLPDPVSAVSDSIQPRSEREVAIARIWSDVLGVDGVGADSNFFEIGGDSITATKIVARCHEQGIAVRVADVFEHQTVGALAAASAPTDDRSTATRSPLPAFAEAYPGVTEVLPLSPFQESLLYEILAADQPSLYVLQFSAELVGERRLCRPRIAWSQLVDRHAALRTAIAWKSRDHPVQLVFEASDVSLLELDWSDIGCNAAAVQQRFEALLSSERARGFDLSQPALVRAVLIDLDQSRQLLAITGHHLVLDAWSMSIIADELFALDDEGKTGLPAALASPGTYRDYLSHLADVNNEEAATFWARRLEGFSEPTLVGRRGRGGDGGRVRRSVAPDLCERLEEMARQQRLTVNSIFEGVFAVLLARLAGQDDVLFGLTVANRFESIPNVERIVGPCINTVPCRIQLHPEATVIEWLRALQREQHANARHSTLRLSDLRQHTALSNSAPVFEALLAVDNYVFSGPGVQRSDSSNETSFHLVFALSRSDGLTLDAHYLENRFLSGEVEAICDGFISLLEQVIELPQGRLSALSLPNPFDEPRAPGEPTTSPVSLFRSAAARFADSLAVVCDSDELTYSQLDQQSDQLAERLRDEGVTAESIVALCLPRSLSLIIALLAVWKAGGAFALLDPEQPIGRLQTLVSEAEAELALSSAEFSHIADQLGIRVVSVEQGAPIGTVARSSARTDLQTALAYVIFTSGSTGRPKAVGLSRAGLANLVRAESEAFGIGPGSRVLQFAPLAFDAAVAEIAVTLLSGGTLHLVPPGDRAEKAWQALEDGQVDVVTVPPALLAAAQPGSLPAELTLVVAGEVCPPTVARAWAPGRRFVNAYGPSEATVCAALHPVSSPIAEEIVPIGRPLPGMAALVVDRDMNRLPVGVAGELLLGGVALARGYLGQPGLTAERFVPNPFDHGGDRLYRTGDRVRWNEDGELEMLGRLDAQVKVRGSRVEPAEVEQVLVEHSAVTAAAATAVDGELVAYFAACRELSAQELRTFLANRLPEFMIPSRFVQLPSLPLTSVGKVDRRRLEGASLSRIEYVPPRTPLERVLAAMWEEELEVTAVGALDDFVELGGHSLAALRLVWRIRDQLGLDVTLRSLFQYRRLAELAKLLEAGNGAEALPPVVPTASGSPDSLSFSQEGLWFLDRLAPGSAAYNVPVAIRLRGPLDDERLEACLLAAAARHEVLQTVFREDGDGTVRSRPSSAAMTGLRRCDLTGQGGDGFELERLLAEEAQRPFNLENGPLLRLLLVRASTDDHTLLLVAHHIVCDGWSGAVLLEEVARLYSGEELPPLSVQYRDYAHWQRREMHEGRLSPQVDYWCAELADRPVLALPRDRLGSRTPLSVAAAVAFTLEAEVVAGINRLARDQRVTPFMVLLAAYQLVLGRFAGQDDLTVGTPVACRTRPELGRMVGSFMNPLVLRGDLSGDPTIGELLARTRDRVTAAYASQDVPFGRVVEALNPVRDSARAPLFEAALTIADVPSQQADLWPAELAVESIDVPAESAAHEVHLFLSEQSDAAIVARLVYAAALFDRATIEELARAFVAALEHFAEVPADRLSNLSLLASGAQARLLSLESGRSCAAPATLSEMFEEQVERDPNAIAVESPGDSLTYRQLNNRAERLAQRLRSVGVGRDEVVAVLLERSPSMIASILGISKAGAAFMLLDPDFPAERIALLLTDSGANVVLTSEALRSKLPSEQCPMLIVCDESQDEVGEGGIEAVMPTQSARANNLAYVIYTSGSTGTPKAVAVEHIGIANLVRAQAEAFAVAPGKRILQFAAPSFDAAVAEIAVTLLSGATLVLLPPGDRVELAWEAIREQEIDVVTLPPAMLAGEAPERLAGVSTLVVAGEAFTPEVLRPFVSGRRVVNAYGPTETTVCATLQSVGEIDPERTVPIGQPLPGTSAFVVDSDDNLLPFGAIGELLIGGTCLARGYLHRSGLTAERFMPNPFASDGSRLYRTGDRVRRVPNGALEFIGRLDDQVKLRGFRIEPAEVEAELLRYPTLTAAAAVVRRDGVAGDRLVAYVTGSEPLDTNALRAFLAERLPTFMIPAIVVQLDRLPMTDRGKVDRRRLPNPEDAPRGEPAPPRNPMEALVCGIAAELLDQETVGVNENFFMLGGHSLSAAGFVSRIRGMLDVEIPVSAIFEAPTLGDLAETIAAVCLTQAPAEDQAASSAV